MNTFEGIQEYKRALGLLPEGEGRMSAEVLVEPDGGGVTEDLISRYKE